jgi:uncharacterized protein (UPF0335 family)
MKTVQDDIETIVGYVKRKDFFTLAVRDAVIRDLRRNRRAILVTAREIIAAALDDVSTSEVLAARRLLAFLTRVDRRGLEALLDVYRDARSEEIA